MTEVASVSSGDAYRIYGTGMAFCPQDGCEGHFTIAIVKNSDPKDKQIVVLEQDDLMKLAQAGVRRTKAHLHGRGIPEEELTRYQQRCYELMGEGKSMEEAAVIAMKELVARRPDLPDAYKGGHSATS